MSTGIRGGHAGKSSGNEGAERGPVIRNVIIYVVAVMALSVAGGFVLARGSAEGALILVIGPILTAVLPRTFGRDGWTDAGLRLGPPKWYVFALLVFPLSFGAIVGLGVATNQTGASVGRVPPTFVCSLTVAAGASGYWPAASSHPTAPS